MSSRNNEVAATGNEEWFDWDIVFAYDTVKILRVLDRRLGLVYYVCQIIIMTYFFFILVVQKEYHEKEKVPGWITVKVLNSQKSTYSHLGEELGITWDNYDRITNPGELGAVFIPTRVVITRGQEQGDEVFCRDPQHMCVADSECDVNNRRIQLPECEAGGCMRRQWCPAEDVDADTSETHYLDLTYVELWFQTSVHFHKFDLDVSTTDERRPREFPMRHANTYPVHDILRMARLDPDDPDAVRENGGVVHMNVIFDCDLDLQTCESKLASSNVDTVTGFNHVWNNYYYDEEGNRKRDSYRMYGIRFLAFATGIGHKTVFPMIVTQIASALALSTVAGLITDFWMQALVAERKSYTEQKIEQTEDFGDS